MRRWTMYLSQIENVSVVYSYSYDVSSCAQISICSGSAALSWWCSNDIRDGDGRVGYSDDSHTNTHMHELKSSEYELDIQIRTLYVIWIQREYVFVCESRTLYVSVCVWVTNSLRHLNPTSWIWIIIWTSNWVHIQITGVRMCECLCLCVCVCVCVTPCSSSHLRFVCDATQYQYLFRWREFVRTNLRLQRLWSSGGRKVRMWFVKKMWFVNCEINLNILLLLHFLCVCVCVCVWVGGCACVRVNKG